MGSSFFSFGNNQIRRQITLLLTVSWLDLLGIRSPRLDPTVKTNLKIAKLSYLPIRPSKFNHVLATVRFLAADGTPDAHPPPASRLQREGEAAARAVTG